MRSTTTPRWKAALAVVTAGALVLLACTGDDDTATTTTTTTSTTEPEQFERAVFASLRDVPFLDGSPYSGPDLPTSLDEVLISPRIADTIAAYPEIGDMLAEQGVAIVPSDHRLFQQPYSEEAYADGTPVFVSTDVAYHLTHLAFSKVLRTAEAQTFLPVLEGLLTDLEAAAAEQTDELAGTELADAAARAEQLIEAAATLAGVDVGPIGPLAQQGVALALAASQIEASPILGFACDPTQSPEGCTNYTLFQPRGHYTRSADLERWFRGMSALGLLGAELDQPEAMQVLLLASRALDSDPALGEAWRLVYEPTAFLVGAADDYTPVELTAVADDVAPGWREDPEMVADLAVMEELADGLEARRQVLIDPEAASVRLMGVRFVIDAFALDQLAWPNVGTAEDSRVEVSALDVAASMSSPLAEELQQASGQFDFANYESQLRANQALFAERPLQAWAATVYDAWLWALLPSWSEKTEQYPPVVRTDAWEAKSLQTGLGSYTERKHDTILYAKQAFAAEGDVPARLFEPRHWVEPDPVVFGRLDAVLDLLADGLSSRDLLDDESAALLDELGDLMTRLEQLATDELAGAPISAEDNEWLRGIGSVIEAFWLRTSDIDPETLQPSSTDQDAALIADIFTSTERALEVATGRIDQIYVLVPNDDGRFEVAKGGVYSHYEFWQPIAERLTDEEWRAMLDDGTAPDRPAWQDVFLVGS
jgi:Protein of unknown function (DUF3160)